MTHTVLLVDDDADILHCLARMLQKQPYQLCTARSGDEAVHVLKARGVDAIVADERMPGMSGTALLAWAAGNYPGVVRMMLTGNASVETLVRAINEARVHYVFTKPCNEAHLAITICKALEHQDLLRKRWQLLTTDQERAREREQCARDLEVVKRLVARDLQRPLYAVAQSCRSLVEQYPDAVDAKAADLLGDALEAVSEMQSMMKDLLARPHLRARQSCRAPLCGAASDAEGDIPCDALPAECLPDIAGMSP